MYFVLSFYIDIYSIGFPQEGLHLHKVQNLSRLSAQLARPGLENSAPADVCDIETARLRWGVRDGRSNPLGSAGALGMAA